MCYKIFEHFISSLHLAVGTVPGGAQVKAFFEIPSTSYNYVINDLNLVGLRQVIIIYTRL